MLVSDVFADAESLAYPYIDKSGISPAQLLRQLTALDQEVLTVAAQNAPGWVSVAGTPVTVVLATNPNGYSLTAALSYSDFEYVDKDGYTYPLNGVTDSQFDNPSWHPAYRLEGLKFFPADPLGKRWAGTEARSWFKGDGDQVLYRYVPLVTQLVAKSDTLKSPEAARAYFARSLALTIILSYHSLYGNVPAERLQAEATLVGSLHSSLLLLIARQVPPKQSQTSPGIRTLVKLS